MSISGKLLRILATALLLSTPYALGQDDVPRDASDTGQDLKPQVLAETPDYATELPSAYVTSGHEILAYNRAIKAAESREGAYGASLSESILGLARILQSQGRHDEAIALYKRSLHLTRINEGLYCPQQIPLLQGEIASHKALQNYTQADERQSYLYRVQTRAIGSSDALVTAFMDQAQWQYDAYQLGLGQDAYERLIDMWELYRMAFNDVIEREGEKSPKLLPPLYGMLQAQYLISSFDIRPSTPVFTQEGEIDEGLLRFKAYYAQSYNQGNAIIEAIASIKPERSAEDTPSIAQSLVMLGDWRLWNGKTDEAWEAYRKAATELAHENGAQEKAQQLFGEPVALPAMAAINTLPPVVATGDQAITLAFDVTEYGRVRDIERLDDNAEDDKQAYHLMRQLRNTTFRPRLEAGQPVETEKLVKSFDIQ
jgi:tetratricopeptide (TPR) repeat protein